MSIVPDDSKHGEGGQRVEEERKEPRWDCSLTFDVRWGRDRDGHQTVNEYVLLGELGRGSFGKVQLCERRVGPKPWRKFAMKIMSKSRLRRQSEFVNVPGGFMRRVTAEEKLRQEIEMMRHLFHRSIVLLFEVLEDGHPAIDEGGDRDDRVCLVQEYMEGGRTMTFADQAGVFRRTGGGTVGAFSAGGEVYSEKEAKQLFRDLVEGLLYLHGHGIVHRDIKPDNLLLFENGTLRICDFGCARRIRRDPNAAAHRAGHGTDADLGNEEQRLVDSVGTYAFHAPECVSGDGVAYSGRAADAWAAAVTLYCWIFGQLPFYDESLENLFEMIETGELQVGDAISAELASLLKTMMAKDPRERLKLEDVMAHAWMRDCPDPPPAVGFSGPT